MPYKDPERAREAARERKRRWLSKQRGPNWTDQRGKHGHNISGSKHYRWGAGRLISSHGYVKVRVGKEHRLADANGYAYEHDLVIASADTPGAYLLRAHPREYVVHHRNGDRTDNRLENLIVLSRADHNRLHNQDKPRDELGRFVGKKAAGDLLDGRQWHEFPRQEGCPQ